MEYKLAAVSSNRNSFGLAKFIFLARDGKAASGLGNDLRRIEMPVGAVLDLPDGMVLAGLGDKGFECPDFHPTAPYEVIRQVWGQDGILPEAEAAEVGGSVPWA